jgi:hypothetical protein
VMNNARCAAVTTSAGWRRVIFTRGRVGVTRSSFRVKSFESWLRLGSTRRACVDDVLRPPRDFLSTCMTPRRPETKSRPYAQVLSLRLKKKSIISMRMETWYSPRLTISIAGSAAGADAGTVRTRGGSVNQGE